MIKGGWWLGLSDVSRKGTAERQQEKQDWMSRVSCMHVGAWGVGAAAAAWNQPLPGSSGWLAAPSLLLRLLRVLHPHLQAEQELRGGAGAGDGSSRGGVGRRSSRGWPQAAPRCGPGTCAPPVRQHAAPRAQHATPPPTCRKDTEPVCPRSSSSNRRDAMDWMGSPPRPFAACRTPSVGVCGRRAGRGAGGRGTCQPPPLGLRGLPPAGKAAAAGPLCRMLRCSAL